MSIVQVILNAIVLLKSLFISNRSLILTFQGKEKPPFLAMTTKGPMYPTYTND